MYQEIARKYEVNANQLSTWRKIFLEKGEYAFKNEITNHETQLEKQIGQLEQLIGKKEIEINL